MNEYIIDLNGKWNAFGKNERGEDISFTGEVPGCVHTDLMAAGILPDIYYRDNSKLSQWIENESFTYERSFTVPTLMSGGYIEFSGLDTYSSVYLNDTLIGCSDNMFLTYNFPVDGILREGENHIRVTFRSPIKEVEGCPSRSGCFTTERMNTRRIQCTYGWDWVDRFVTMGIYKDVKIAFRRPNEIASVYAYTSSVTDFGAEIRLECEIRDFVRRGDNATIEILSPIGEVVFKRERAIIEPKLYENVCIRSPKLWYPNGYGDQPLYKINVYTPTSSYSLDFGIRTVTILQIEDEIGSLDDEKCRKMREYTHLKDLDFNERGASFTVVVNNVKIMCKGANWVPSEPFPSAEDNEKISSLLTLGKEAGLNMLRVWGGGIFEREHFYKECTRLGIMVSQDFLMACGSYPENEEWFIEALRKEARCAALNLRNHTCLVWWTGDNENAVNGNDNITDFPGYKSATYGISPILRELDPMRVFLPSSPYGGDKYSSATRGTTHVSNFMGEIYHHILESDLSDYREYFSKFYARFIAEQPTMGMPFLSSLRRFMTDEDIFGEDESISEFHTKHNPDLGEISVYTFIRAFTKNLFGDFHSGEDRLLKMQMMQCEWVRMTFELTRRNKWFSSGILYWMFNDCWPAANGWSLLDYYGMPKPGYYSFKRCASPIIASIDKDSDNMSVYVCSDSMDEMCGKGELYVYDLEDGATKVSYPFTFSLMGGESKIVLSVPVKDIGVFMDGDSVVLCDIQSESGDSDRAYFVEGRYADTTFTYETPKIIEDDGEYIKVRAESFNPCAIIDTPYVLSENAFPIKAGEVRKIKILRMNKN